MLVDGLERRGEIAVDVLGEPLGRLVLSWRGANDRWKNSPPRSAAPTSGLAVVPIRLRYAFAPPGPRSTFTAM